MLIIDAQEQPITQISEDTELLIEDLFHECQYFPEDTDETMTFTAGGTPNVFGAWAEIVDNNGVTFSSKFVAMNGHIDSILVENTSAKDEVYVFEIAYGVSTKVIIDRGRIKSASVLVGTTQNSGKKSVLITEGQTIFYRMKCETGGATWTGSFRYHAH